MRLVNIRLILVPSTGGSVTRCYLSVRLSF